MAGHPGPSPAEVRSVRKLTCDDPIVGKHDAPHGLVALRDLVSLGCPQVIGTPQG